MTELSVRNLSIVADGATLVEDASLTLAGGEVVAVLGPNGAGKTSLLRGMLGLLPLSGGHSQLAGQAATDLSPAARARVVSYLPQRRPLAWPNPVRDIVALGRYAHGAGLGRLGTEDQRAVDEALEACDLTALAERGVDSLSGGELARVHFARAIAAEAPLLIADEPVAALDPRHQLRIGALIRSFVDAGGGALLVLHELTMAANIADRLIWMKDGRIVCQGTVTDTLTPATLADVYGVVASIEYDRHGADVRILGST